MSVAEPVPGLIYVDDGAPGYRRRRCGRGFTYLDTNGRTIRDARTIDRLRRLAVPPAWTDVWLCPDPDGHIQATGRDAKGRKQYRYHDDWKRARDEAKFDSLVDFGHALPILRSRVGDDIRRRDLSFDRVVATTVWLLDHTLIRVGNAEYAKDSYGLTTLLDEHVDVTADTIKFRFVGKSGKQHDLVLSDRRVAKIVSECQDLPGQQLLQYLVDDDAVRGIGSRDVNDYIREATHTAFTAKTFRTWGASAYTLGRAAPPRTGRHRARCTSPGPTGGQGHRRAAAQHGNGLPSELHPPACARIARRRPPAHGSQASPPQGRSDGRARAATAGAARRMTNQPPGV